MMNKYRTDVENFVDAVAIMDSNTDIEIRLINNGKNGKSSVVKRIPFRNYWQANDDFFRLDLATAYRDLMRRKEDEPWTRADDLELS